MTLLKNKTFLISIALWCIITIVRILNHIPWFDEAHAWTIAEELNLVQIFHLMKVEGHTFIWYLLLIPFAKFHIGYPYVMQFLNWIFCLGALIVLWQKAPFNNFIKVLITFSFPFTYVYSVYARCYSIGILLLFLLAALFENRLKHPILYSLVLIVCANTSTMALIGSAAFGFLFIYDFLKSMPKRKSLLAVSAILFIGAGLIFLQLFGVDSTAIKDYRGINLPYQNLLKIFVISSFILITCILPLVFFLRKHLKILFFFLFTTVFMSVCFMFKYYGHYWNHAFYWLYFMITIWLGLLACENEKIKKFMSVLLAAVSFLHIFIPLFVNDVCLKLTQNGDAVKMAKIVLYDKNMYKKAIISANDNFVGHVLVPYNRHRLVNYCEDKPFNYDIVNYPANNNLCYEKELPNRFFNEYYTYLDKNRLIKLVNKNIGNDDEIYSIVSINPKAFENSDTTFIKDDKTEIFYSIQRYKCLKNKKQEDFCIYKIKKENN